MLDSTKTESQLAWLLDFERKLLTKVEAQNEILTTALTEIPEATDVDPNCYECTNYDQASKKYFLCVRHSKKWAFDRLRELI